MKVNTNLSDLLTEIEAQGISDKKVLHAMSQVPREAFIPDDLKMLAYANRPLPIDCGQTISQPYIVAYMLEFLNLKPFKRVLEIGTGSGYNAAVLSKLAKIVYTVELNSTLANEAQEKLTKLGIDNVIVTQGDGHFGLSHKGPFDAIIFTAAAQEVPTRLFDQLAPEGRMIAPVGEENQNLFLWHKGPSEGDDVSRELLIPVRFVTMNQEQTHIKDRYNEHGYSQSN